MSSQNTHSSLGVHILKDCKYLTHKPNESKVRTYYTPSWYLSGYGTHKNHKI